MLDTATINNTYNPRQLQKDLAMIIRHKGTRKQFGMYVLSSYIDQIISVTEHLDGTYRVALTCSGYQIPVGELSLTSLIGLHVLTLSVEIEDR